MRPLVVLLLVLASLAALLVALTTLSDSGRHGDDSRGTAVRATPDRPIEPAILVEPVTPTEGAAAAASNEGARTAVAPAKDPKGPKVAFGAIEGEVIDEDGKPIAGAKVSLFDTKPGALGEEFNLLRGSEPPRPLFKTETNETGSFRFDQLDPRKDWSLSVAHERYEHFVSELPIPVPEGGVYPESIVLRPGQTMSGVVVAAGTRVPIAGALLVAENPFALTAANRKRAMGRLEARTDANGAYLFTNLGTAPAQNRMLTVSAPGYATQIYSNYSMVTFTEPEKDRRRNTKPDPVQMIGRSQDFELMPGMVIAGRVVGPEQAGMAGVAIEAMNQTGTIGSGGTTESGKSGEFLIEGLAEGLYTLRVTAAKYDAAPLQRVESGDTNVVIELFEQASVTGKVVDSDGRAMTNFVVKARTTNEVSNAYGAVVAHRAIKGSTDGRFELGGLPEGAYVIEGLVEGYASCFSDPFTATQGMVTSDVVVRMNHGGSMSGQVLDGYTSLPISGVEITTNENDWIDGTTFFDLFGALEPSAMTKAKVFTDEQGRFSVEVMTPGTYQLSIRGRGFAPKFLRDVTVVEGQNTEVPQQLLIKGAVISGIVYGRTSTVQAGCSVQLNPADPNASDGFRTTRSDGTGRFTIENVEPGTYLLTATRPSNGNANPFEALVDMKQSEVTITIEDGGTYPIELHLGLKRGK